MQDMTNARYCASLHSSCPSGIGLRLWGRTEVVRVRFSIALGECWRPRLAK